MPFKPLPPEQRRPRFCMSIAPDVLAWVEAQREKEGLDRSHFVEAALVAYRAERNGHVDER